MGEADPKFIDNCPFRLPAALRFFPPIQWRMGWGMGSGVGRVIGSGMGWKSRTPTLAHRLLVDELGFRLHGGWVR